MLKAIAFGLAVGAGVQAWRQWPADGPVTPWSLAVVFAVGVLCAYLGGRWHGRRHASAWSSAHAEAHAEASSSSTATQSVQLAVIVPGQGPRGMGIPSEAAPWLAGAGPVAEFSADDLDGMDLAELLPDSSPEAAG